MAPKIPAYNILRMGKLSSPLGFPEDKILPSLSIFFHDDSPAFKFWIWIEVKKKESNFKNRSPLASFLFVNLENLLCTQDVIYY